MEELKPCRCGCRIEVDKRDGAYYFTCSECHRRVGVTATSYELAVKTWNERYSIDTLIKDLRGVCRALEVASDFVGNAKERICVLERNRHLLNAVNETQATLSSAIKTTQKELEWRENYE